MLFLVMCITLNFYLTITLNMAVGNSLIDIEGNIATVKMLLITILMRTYNYIICQVIILMHLNTFLNKFSAYFITFSGNFYIIWCLRETWACTAVRFKPPEIKAMYCQFRSTKRDPASGKMLYTQRTWYFCKKEAHEPKVTKHRLSEVGMSLDS